MKLVFLKKHIFVLDVYSIIIINQNDISSKQDINDKEIQLLELLEQEPTITLVKAAEKLGWKETLVKYYVASLKKKKMLSRNGTSHNGVWVVSKD